MKATATSQFHGPSMSVSFVGLTLGANWLKLRSPKSRYCLDYSSNNTHVCGCGYPVTRTDWELSDDKYEIESVSHRDQISEYGTGYLRIVITEKRN